MKMRNKFLAALFTLCIVLSMTVVTAFAQGGTAETVFATETEVSADGVDFAEVKTDADGDAAQTDATETDGKTDAEADDTPDDLDVVDSDDSAVIVSDEPATIASGDGMLEKLYKIAKPDAARYDEQNVAFVDDVNNVLTLNFGSPQANVTNAIFRGMVENNRFSFELKDPDGNAIPLDNPKATFIVNKIYWEMSDKINDAAKAGEYTLTMSDTQAPEIEAKDFKFTVVAVKFITGEHGKFSGGGTEETHYGMAESGLSNFNVSQVEKTDDMDFIGWATTQNVSEYEKLHSGKISSNEKYDVATHTYTFYAAYGMKKTTKIEFFAKDPSVNLEQQPLNGWGETLKFKDAVESNQENMPTLSFWIKNTGTEDVQYNGVPKTGNIFTIEEVPEKGAIQKKATGKDGPQRDYLLPGKQIEVKLTPKKGLSLGTHTHLIPIRANGSILQISVAVEVSSKVVYVKPLDIEKTYGETKSSSDVEFEVYDATQSNKLNDVDLKSLNVTFESEGFSDNAAVGEHGIKLLSADNSSYKVQLYNKDDAGKVIVKKAKVIGEGTVTADTIYEGQSLSGSALHGTFNNSKKPEWEVTGKLEWDDDKNGGTADAIVPKIGTHQYHWKFTPDEQHIGNYEGVEGTVIVTVTDKEITTLSLTAGQTGRFTYNGRPHSMSFTSDRPAGEEQNITVEYSPADENNFTKDQPVKAGTYDVRAHIAATTKYAEAEATTKMTIAKKTLSVHYAAIGKVYDGTTAAEVRIVVSDKVGNDDVTTTVASADFADPNVGTKLVHFTLSELTGKDKDNYSLPFTASNQYATITAAKASVEVTGDKLTKYYGQELEMTADQFTFTNDKGVEIKGVTGAQFTSEGAAFDSDAGEYDIAVSLVSSNFELLNDTIENGLVVEKVTPKLLDDVITTGSGKIGSKLGDISISGDFVSPYNDGLEAEGNFAWKEPDSNLPGVAGTYDAEWTFTLSDAAKKNFNAPEGGTATVTVLGKESVQIDVQHVTVEYDAEPHGVKVENVNPKDVALTYQYRRHLDVAAVALMDDAWSGEEPIDAGDYDVLITAVPADTETYATTEIMTTLTITKATPNISGLKTELEALQGSAFDNELAKQMGMPKGVGAESDTEITGVYVPAANDAVIEEDGLSHNWTFMPEGDFANNYHSVSGSVRIMLTADDRELDVKIYNLPDGDGYNDYAVVKCKNGELKVGDIITIYDNAPESSDGAEYLIVGTATVSEADVERGYIEFNLDKDGLGNDARTVNVRITSSKKHPAQTVQIPAEMDVLVDESVKTYVGDTANLSAKLMEGYSEEDIVNVRFSVNEGDYIEVTSEANKLAAQIKGLNLGHAHIDMQVQMKHPDPAKAAAGEEITIIKRIHVDVVLPLGDLAVNNQVTGDFDPNKDFKFTVKLKDSTVNGKYNATVGEVQTQPTNAPRPSATRNTIVEFKNGIAEFTLKPNQFIVIHDLPKGGYTVSISYDNEEGYQTQVGSYEGNIEPGKTKTDNFVTNVVDVQTPPDPPHTHSGDWKFDAENHWKECDECGAKFEMSAHKFGDWKVTKEATATQTGIKERKCTNCGYTETAEIPATGVPASDGNGNSGGNRNSDTTQSPHTGDNSHLALWFALLVLGGCGVIATVVINRKKKYNR